MQNNKFNLPEWHLLRVTNQSSHKPSLSLFGGLTPFEKPLTQIKKEMKKALRVGYKKVLLPWNSLQHKNFQNLKDFIKENPSPWVLQVPLTQWNNFKNQGQELLKEKDLTFDLLLEHPDNLKTPIRKDLTQLTSFQITIPAWRDINVREIIKTLPPFLLDKVCIHFPCFHKKHPQLYSSREMFEFLREKHFPSPKTDVFNLSIPEDLKLEPELEPNFYHEVPNSKPLISVIIPSYQCKKPLSFVLQHLCLQKLSKNNFEIIVIDDGSQDGTKESLLHNTLLKNLNFKYTFLPREKKRRLGDSRFRAAVARNLGAKQAQGAVLAFLDSDILVGENWLPSILKAMEKTNVVQHPRYHLKIRAPKKYSKINKNLHTFIKGKGYWEGFYDKGPLWNNLELPWKYISTNTLCVKKEVFERVGRFRRNYTSYGFEDTDLGWRLYHTGEKFFLNPRNTYHILRRSEFLHLNFVKQYLLGQSAHIFFHNTHCLKGYQEFRHLIKKRGL